MEIRICKFIKLVEPCQTCRETTIYNIYSDISPNQPIHFSSMYHRLSLKIFLYSCVYKTKTIITNKKPTKSILPRSICYTIATLKTIDSFDFETHYMTIYSFYHKNCIRLRTCKFLINYADNKFPSTKYGTSYFLVGPTPKRISLHVRDYHADYGIL